MQYMWPELQKARDNARRVQREIENVLVRQNSLERREIANHCDSLIAEFEDAMQKISNEIDEMKQNLSSHKKCLAAKANFIERHYKIKKH